MAIRHSKRKAGEAPEITDPAVIENAHKKPKKTNQAASQAATNQQATNQPAANTRKFGKTAAGLPSNLPHVVPHPYPPVPSPFTTAMERSEILELSTNPAVDSAIEQLVSTHPPDFGEAQGRAFARWFRPGSAGATIPAERGLMRIRPVVSESWIGDLGEIVWDDHVSKFKNRRRGRATGPKAGRRAMEVVREQGEEAANYFLRWRHASDVMVNGRVCSYAGGVDWAIGPLPDFAVIEVEGVVIFWWKKGEALECMPPDIVQLIAEKTRQAELEKERLDEERKKEQGEVVRKRTGWYDKYREALRNHKGEQDADPMRNEFRRQQIRSTENLEDDQVFLGIASVWQPLKATSNRFAFNGASEYQRARYALSNEKSFEDPVPSTVQGPEDFIMPLVFNGEYQSLPVSADQQEFPDSAKESQPVSEPDAKKKEGLLPPGHTVFAVAQRGSGNTINWTAMDSCPGYLRDGRIRDAVIKSVHRMGWLVRDDEGRPAALDFEPVFEGQPEEVPTQESVDSCGIHTILNGWRCMLGLPALGRTARLYQPDELFARGLEEGEFIKAALSFINLAIAGHMDTGAIQAFLNYFGFCELQDPDDEDDLVDALPTARMTNEILSTQLAADRAAQRTEAFSAAAPSTAAHSMTAPSTGQIVNPASEATQDEAGDRPARFDWRFLSPETQEDLLARAGGDREVAEAIYLSKHGA
ncbi:MAG: hypothetical protein Q9201_006527 [Fulgogasparrea decipioides]